MSWTDEVFRKQFRMDKDQFLDVVDRCKRAYPGRYSNGIDNYKLAQIRGDAGSKSGSITMELKVAITLRLLAGASYLDMVWYGVAINTVAPVFKFTVLLMDIALPNLEFFNMPETEAQCEQTAKEWSDIMRAKRHADLMPGTLLAGDGLVVHIEAPTAKDREGLDLTVFRNRKGCYGLIVQAFCDAHCRFRYWDVLWPGSTPDITCYKQTRLYRMFLDGKIPNKFHMVLDEAYSSIGGDQHLCPYSKAQLQSPNTNPQLYLRMKAFNNILSSQRITIERAFGMFVRKWGIFWRPLSAAFGIAFQCRLLRVCAKLHNMCIDYRLRKNQATAAGDEEEAAREPADDRGRTGVLRWREYDDGDAPSDEAVREMMDNYARQGVQRACRVDSAKRSGLRENIYDKGFRYDHRRDLDFTMHPTIR